MKRRSLLLPVVLSLFACLVAEWSHAAIDRTWCTHDTAQRVNADVDGDGQVDAICHDQTGTKWIALRESGGLTERFNTTLNWCSHRGAVLFVGDVNGDRRADLVCKDSSRIWVDYGASDFFQGTDFSLATNWCTHAGGVFSVADQDFDGRADLVCTNADGSVFVDLADTSGRFAGTDFFGRCITRTSIPHFHDVAEPRTDASAQNTGDMKASLSSVLAEDNAAETFVGTTGFSNAPRMPILVSVGSTVVSGQLRLAGPPFLGHGETGAALKLVVSDASGRELCSDEHVLNEQGFPGFNFDVPLGASRQLTCSANVSGNYRARVHLRAWASAVGAITTSADAHVRVLSISSRECTSG